MSRDGHVDLALGGAVRRFRLAIGDLEALQEATGLGPADLLHRLHAGRAYGFRDLCALLRLALIGGGTPPGEAHAHDLDGLPCLTLIATATLVLAAGLEGAEDERVGRWTRPGPARPDGRMAFAPFYEAAAAMGLPVADLRAMSLWQFAAYLDGFNRMHGPEPMSAEEEDALWAWIRAETAGAPHADRA
ncbi:gene transfer agent family protein [Methylobacterium sp. ID0610]|uniref:gene transfer agent family protein n=1 Tax=Methylobacterium carpenticola TaxID=3344827 RepID=UPI003681214C